MGRREDLLIRIGLLVRCKSDFLTLCVTVGDRGGWRDGIWVRREWSNDRGEERVVLGWESRDGMIRMECCLWSHSSKLVHGILRGTC